MPAKGIKLANKRIESSREQKLAVKLRENLLRRKQQARTRAATVGLELNPPEEAPMVSGKRDDGRHSD